MKLMAKIAFFALSLLVVVPAAEANFAYYFFQGKKTSEIVGLCNQNKKPSQFRLTYIDDNKKVLSDNSLVGKKIEDRKQRKTTVLKKLADQKLSLDVLTKKIQGQPELPEIRCSYPEHQEQNAIKLHKEGRLPSRSPFVRPSVVAQNQSEQLVFIDHRRAALYQLSLVALFLEILPRKLF